MAEIFSSQEIKIVYSCSRKADAEQEYNILISGQVVTKQRFYLVYVNLISCWNSVLQVDEIKKTIKSNIHNNGTT